MESSAVNLVLLPLGLGLLGFLEPCSIGSSLLFLKSVNLPSVRLVQAAVFTAARALFIGALGAVAALVGTAFLSFQRAAYIPIRRRLCRAWVDLSRGTGEPSYAQRRPRLAAFVHSARLARARGTVPACAGPLLAAVLASAAVTGGAKVGRGFLPWRCSGLACRCRCFSRWHRVKASGFSRRPLAIYIAFLSPSVCCWSRLAFGRSISARQDSHEMEVEK
jgi:cytochrome c-type biogenesis protein